MGRMIHANRLLIKNIGMLVGAYERAPGVLSGQDMSRVPM